MRLRCAGDAARLGAIQGRNALGFAIEMIGDFDQGKDKLEGNQLDAILEFAAFFVEFWGLNPDQNIKFHREYASKTCPGTGIDKAEFVEGVKEVLGMTSIKVVINDQTLSGFVKDGVSYAPVKQLANALGAREIKWNAEDKKVTVLK